MRIKELYFSNGLSGWRVDWGLDTWSQTLLGLCLRGQGSTCTHTHPQSQDTMGAPRKTSTVFSKFARSQNHLGCVKKPHVWALPRNLQGRSPRICLFSSVPVESYKQKKLGKQERKPQLAGLQLCCHPSCVL